MFQVLQKKIFPLIVPKASLIDLGVSISINELTFYAFGIFVLFLTPGPVWIAIISRSISRGFYGAIPLAAGVALGDLIWPSLAIAGSTALVASYTNLLMYLKYLAVISSTSRISATKIKDSRNQYIPRGRRILCVSIMIN